MKIRITGRSLQSFDPGGGVNNNPFKINFPMPPVSGEPKPEEAPEGYFNQEPPKQQTRTEQLYAATGLDFLNPNGEYAKANQGAKLNMNTTPQLSGWDQLGNKVNKITDKLMDKTFGNPFSLYNMAGFAGNVVDGINNRRDRKRAEQRENNFFSTTGGIYSEQDPDILSRGIRAVSGTQRNKDLPNQISGYSSWQGMNQMYNSPFRAELGLTVDSIMGAPEMMAEATPSMPAFAAPNVTAETGAGTTVIGPTFDEPTTGRDMDLRTFISQKESGGRYDALPKDKNGHLVSSAAGKYQFLWNQHKTWISKVTGVNSKDEFLRNPGAQEKAFDYWNQTTLTPWTEKIKKELGINLPDVVIKSKVHFSGGQGAYDYFKTGKVVRDGFGTTTATYADGGEITNDMEKVRIRITGLPVNKMEYGGQSGYGLDLGQRKVYEDMPEDRTDSASNVMTQKSADQMQPGEYPVIMAEDKETVLSDMDGDGELEFKRISGDPHSAPSGGTKLTNLQLNPNPEKNGQGAFIFSHKLKIKDPEMLKRFGIGGSKVSFADASRRFDVTPEKKILDNPNADALAKKTAELSKGVKENMLQKLAQHQEEIKGFPQGAPDIYKSLATAAYGGYLPIADGGMQKDDPPAGYRQRTPGLNSEREMAEFDDINDVTRYYRRQGYAGSDNNIGEWQNWMVAKAQQDPFYRERLLSYLRSVPLTNKGRSLYGANADKSKLSDEQLFEQFKDGKWDFRAPKIRPLEQPIRVPRDPKPTTFVPKTIPLKPPTLIPPGKIPPPGNPPGTIPPPVKRGDDYLPYNDIQKANTLWAASRPVKGYYDRPFNANITGVQAMFDEANYDPLLSANATRMDFMNQFGNAQAARASGTYNPQLNEGLVGETARVRGTNLQIGNQTLAMNNQLFNQDAMMRAREADQVRENNIRTREQLDIAKNLKYNDVMKNYGKMVNDHIAMQKYNLLNPQFAVSGPLWNKFNFTKGRAFGTTGANTSPFMSRDEFAKSNPGFAAAYKSGDASKMLEADKMYNQYINQQRSLLMRPGNNFNSNINNPMFMDNMGY